MPLLDTFDYRHDPTLDLDQVVLVSTVAGGTVLHHPDATEDQINVALGELMAAIADRQRGVWGEVHTAAVEAIARRHAA